MGQIRLIAFFVCSLTACSQTPLPQLPLGVAQDLQNTMVIDSGQFLESARLAEARLDYLTCLEQLKLFAAVAPKMCDASFWQWQARIADKVRDTQSALDARLKWLECSPDDVWLLIDIADGLSRLDRLEEAIEMLKTAVDDPQNQKDLDAARIYLLEHNGMLKRAAELCIELAAQSELTQAKLYYQKASILYEESGDLAAATEAISMAFSDEQLTQISADELVRLRSFELGEPQNVADARKLLYLHSEGELRLIGIRYLVRGHYQGDLQDYIYALNDPNMGVVEVAISQVAIKGNSESLLLIENFLNHSDREIKLAAIRAYESLGAEKDAQLIVAGIDVDDREMFRAWRLCLEKLTNHSIGVDLDPDLDARKSIVQLWQQYLGN
jgi:tetratricopeptide (TPR) repeat protein